MTPIRQEHGSSRKNITGIDFWPMCRAQAYSQVFSKGDSP